MTGRATLRVTWAPRPWPLVACAMLVRGEPARALCLELLKRDDEALKALRGVAGDGLMVLLGAEPELPWIDDAEWLGRDPNAPALLLPTALSPSVPVGLFERAVLRLAATAATPLAVTASHIVSVAAARPLVRAKLSAFAMERPR